MRIIDVLISILRHYDWGKWHPEIPKFDGTVYGFNCLIIAWVGKDGAVAEGASAEFHTARETADDMASRQKAGNGFA